TEYGNHVATPGRVTAADLQASTSAAVAQVVNAETTTTLTTTPNPSTAGQAVTLTARVVPVAPATGVPTGVVTFRDGATTIGTATLGANGSGTAMGSAIVHGNDSLTAVYGGSGDFQNSASAMVTQVVKAVNAAG